MHTPSDEFTQLHSPPYSLKGFTQDLGVTSSLRRVGYSPSDL